MSKSLVSIIIPTKNESKNIKRCLLSCQDQTYKNIEIIIIDNYSTDNTLDIAKQFTKNIYLAGFERSQQRNYGAAKAKGIYLLFLDADMELETGLVKSLITEVKNGEYRAIIIPEKSTGRGFWAKSVALERSCYLGDPTIEAARLFEKKLFDQLGGFDENLTAAEDWDLTLRAKTFGAKISRIKNFLMHHETNSFKNLVLKKYYYAQDISSYAKKHPYQFIKQSNLILRPAYLRNWQKLAKDPLYTTGFLTIKIFQTILGAIGFLRSKRNRT